MQNEIAGFTMLVAMFTLVFIFIGLHTNTKRVNRDTQGNKEFQKHIEAQYTKQNRLHKHKPEKEIDTDLSPYLID